MYKIGQNKKHTYIPTIVSASILCLILSSIGLFLWYHETVIEREVNILSFEELQSGRHLVDKFPFIVNVDDDEVGVAYENRWDYEISYFKEIHIPSNYVGILSPRNNKAIDSNQAALLPGNHKVNLAMYYVKMINTEVQPSINN